MMQATICVFLAAALAILPVAPARAATISLPGSPFGIAWGFVYGYAGVPAPAYMPFVRDLGGGLTKIYVFWNQVEPQRGRYEWSAIDAYVAQLRAPEEGLISVFSASQWATQRSTTMLPPSPPKNLDDYYQFIYALVRHCGGRVRYWENDAEPNNPIYWSGTADQFVDELHVFYRAVKAADPSAIVIAGGFDGRFNPPGMAPLLGQEAGLAFFDRVLERSRDDFDLFDLRLYFDPYTIPGRVAYFADKMKALGYSKPIVSTEYGGPIPFDFPENGKYATMLGAWSRQIAARGNAAPANPLDDMYAHMSELAPQTQMFMLGAPPALQAEYERIQGRELVVRTILGLAAGVQKMIYWQFLGDTGRRDDVMTFMYGKTGMYASGVGQLPIADVYRRMTGELQGVTSVDRVLTSDPSIYCFAVERGSRAKLYVVWQRRDAFSLHEAPPVEMALPWSRGSARALDAFGGVPEVRLERGTLRLPVASTPIYVE